ncbi:hypothetical protein ACMFMF_001357 [Clarireedia jacksonii]
MLMEEQAQRYGGQRSLDELYFRTRCYIVTLAGFFSKMLEFSIADMMLPELNKFDPLHVLNHLQRSLNFQRQDQFNKSFRELEDANWALSMRLAITRLTRS